MRVFLFILFITILIACNNILKVDVPVPPPEKPQKHTIKLIDSFGSVTIQLPARYDTNFSWTHFSDCGSLCDRIKYRFQPKFLPINKESGWMWFDLKDSIESFTIVHSGYFYSFHQKPDTSHFWKIHEQQKESLIKHPDSYKIKSDTIEKIDNHNFSIFTIDLYDSVKLLYTKKVIASTYIKSNAVEFNF